MWHHPIPPKTPCIQLQKENVAQLHQVKKLWFDCSRAVLEGVGLHKTPTINNEQQKITNYLKPEQRFTKMSGLKADKIKQQMWWKTCKKAKRKNLFTCMVKDLLQSWMACEIFGRLSGGFSKTRTEMPHKRKSKALPSRTNAGAKEKDAKGFVVAINSSAM